MAQIEGATIIMFKEISEFETFYTSNHKLLLKRALLIVGDITVAEDIIHDVFLKLMVKPDSLSKVENKKAYLLRSVSNQAISYWKANQKLFTFDESSESSEIGESHSMWLTSSEDEEDLEIIKNKIKYFLNKLPPRQQLIFKLSRYEGLDHDEIAEFLDISKNTVKNQLVTALSYLRKNLPFAWLVMLDIIDI